jgi:hypothetical protein
MAICLTHLNFIIKLNLTGKTIFVIKDLSVTEDKGKAPPEYQLHRANDMPLEFPDDGTCSFSTLQLQSHKSQPRKVYTAS